MHVALQGKGAHGEGDSDGPERGLADQHGPAALRCCGAATGDEDSAEREGADVHRHENEDLESSEIWKCQSHERDSIISGIIEHGR